MNILDLDDIRQLFSSLKGTITGVGITAYSRIIPASLIRPYRIICLRMTGDLPRLRKEAEILCLEEESGDFIEGKGFNSARLLSSPLVRDYLKDLAGPNYLLLYQSYPELEAFAGEEGWPLMANPASLRLKVAERAFFLEMLDRLKLKRIEGGIVPVQEIYKKEYEFWAGEIGPRLVLQLPDIRQGGGRGTFFINNRADYEGLRERLTGGSWRGIRIKKVYISKFMEGMPVSLALCLTRQGILYSGLQRQLIDPPYCKDIPENGVFYGHSWGDNLWPSHIRDKAIRQADKIGNYLAGLGYKGILGLDFMVSPDKKEIYPLECNCRFTGAFPMLSQLHLSKNIIPLDAFHMLEFLDLPYEVDVVELNEKYEKAVKGGHLILFAVPQITLRGESTPEAGLHEIDPTHGEVRYLREASNYDDFQNENQFIIIDGPPDRKSKGMTFDDPLHRLCRILFPRPIADEKGRLSPFARLAVDCIYNKLYNR